jgi:hypothetical protein
MTGSGKPSPATIRRTRRVPDMILAAAHRACDEKLVDVAGGLLRLCEEVVAEEGDPRRRRQDLWGLIAAHERLWQLRHDPAHSEPATHTPLPVNFGTALSGG